MSDGYDFYKDIIDNLYDGVYFVDRDRVITYWNKGAERITGYSAQQTIGRACRDNLLNHVTVNGVPLCHDNCPLAAVMVDGQDREAEVFVHHADGHRLPIVVRASPIRDQDGNIIGAIESFSNNASVMEARGKLKELRRAALVDPLTGIGNRRFLQGRLSAAISEFQQNETVIGVLFMDVDHFKQFNDTHGHNIGDHVLRMVAKSIRYGIGQRTHWDAGVVRSLLPFCMMYRIWQHCSSRLKRFVPLCNTPDSMSTEHICQSLFPLVERCCKRAIRLSRLLSGQTN